MRGPGQQAAEVLGDGEGGAAGGVVGQARWGLVDEQHVGVGGVARLLAAEAAHADDGEVQCRAGRGHGQGGAQGGVDDGGEGGADRGDVEHPEQVGAGDAEELAAAQGPDRVDRRFGVGVAGGGGREAFGEGLG